MRLRSTTKIHIEGRNGKFRSILKHMKSKAITSWREHVSQAREDGETILKRMEDARS